MRLPHSICKDPTKKFCPSCGGPTLTRTSITYVPPTPENPKGYVPHLRRNYHYRLRGTVYSIPNPLKANAKGGARDELILREDQKEWQRGLKTAAVAKYKEERAALRAMRDPSAPGGPRDPDWMPGMLVGEKGRRQPGEGRIGKDGLPIIGYGRRVRRCAS
jgi:RNA-binding protein NOB1